MKPILPVASIILATLAASSAAFAQRHSDVDNKPVTASLPQNANVQVIKDILRRLEKGAGNGVRIVADSAVVNEFALLPAEATTPENIEAQITALVKNLPKGTIWAKLYLPAPKSNNGYRGDDLAEFADLQARLFGKVGVIPAGSVEVLGKVMPADKARAIIDALDLKQVYLITNPSAKFNFARDMEEWDSMSSEKRKAYAKKEAMKRLAMGPDAYARMFGIWAGRQMAIIGEMFSMMTPEQQEQYRQAMMSQVKDSGAMDKVFPGGGTPTAPQ